MSHNHMYRADFIKNTDILYVNLIIKDYILPLIIQMLMNV